MDGILAGLTSPESTLSANALPHSKGWFMTTRKDNPWTELLRNAIVPVVGCAILMYAQSAVQAYKIDNLNQRVEMLQAKNDVLTNQVIELRASGRLAEALEQITKQNEQIIHLIERKR